MINSLFLLTPKSEVVWVSAYGTLRQAIERMKPNGFAAVPVLDVMRRTNNRAVHVDAKLETLLLRAAEQNFVPVLDDREVFIGIVRRKSIIEQCLPRRSITAALKSKPHSRSRWHRTG